jgi:hypothetical protein
VPVMRMRRPDLQAQFTGPQTQFTGNLQQRWWCHSCTEPSTGALSSSVCAVPTKTRHRRPQFQLDRVTQFTGSQTQFTGNLQAQATGYLGSNSTRSRTAQAQQKIGCTLPHVSRACACEPSCCPQMCGQMVDSPETSLAAAKIRKSFRLIRREHRCQETWSRSAATCSSRGTRSTRARCRSGYAAHLTPLGARQPAHTFTCQR